MKIKKNFLLSLLITPLFLFSNLTERVEVGTRLSNEEEIGSKGEEIQEAGYYPFSQPPVYYSNAHHWVKSVMVQDYSHYSIELEDGSIWKVHPYDGSKILSWRTDEPLSITKNYRWFSSYNHKITNKVTGVSVEVSLDFGPIVLGEHSKYIVAIDYYKGEILLNDNTTWEISSSTRYLLNSWAINDYVIIGHNSDYGFWDSYDSILINVNVKDNPTVNAKQF